MMEVYEHLFLIYYAVGAYDYLLCPIWLYLCPCCCHEALAECA